MIFQSSPTNRFCFAYISKKNEGHNKRCNGITQSDYLPGVALRIFFIFGVVASHPNMPDYAKSITEPLLNLILLFCEKTHLKHYTSQKRHTEHRRHTHFYMQLICMQIQVSLNVPVCTHPHSVRNKQSKKKPLRRHTLRAALHCARGAAHFSSTGLPAAAQNTA